VRGKKSKKTYPSIKHTTRGKKYRKSYPSKKKEDLGTICWIGIRKDRIEN